MITAHIVSIYGREESLQRTIATIAYQVDKVYVMLNGYPSVPEFLNCDVFTGKNVTIHAEILDNSLGDSAKFLHVNDDKGICLVLDDDLSVQRNYASYMVAGVYKYNGLVSLHGRTYLAPVHSFKRWAGNYRCLGTVTEDVHVTLIGSGCCAFDNERLKVSITDFKKKNMADVFLSKAATEQGVPMVVLKHKAGDIIYSPPKDNKTIWRTTTDYSYHTEILKTFIK